MNCKQIMMEYGHLPVDELPADIRARVESTPELREYWDASLHLQRLLRDSVPADPALADRLVFKVRSRLEQPSRQPESLDDSVPAVFSPWRWLGLAACFAVAALGAYRLWMPTPTSGGAPVAAAPSAEDPRSIVLPANVLAATDPSSVTNSVPRIDTRRNSIDGSGAGLVPVFNPQSNGDRSWRMVPPGDGRPAPAP
jgi:hypothetical protein